MTTDACLTTGHHHAHGPANRLRRVLKTAAPLFVRFPRNEAQAAVIVLHDVYGLTELIENYCRWLARSGYIAIAPFFYYDTGGKEFRPENEDTARAAMASLSPDDLAADLTGALDHLASRALIPPAVTGVLGVGMGGYLAAWAAAEHELAAAVSIDPLGAGTAPWPGVPEASQLISRLRTRWLGLARTLRPAETSALVDAAAHSHGFGDVTVAPDDASEAEFDGYGCWDEALRFLDARLG